MAFSFIYNVVGYSKIIFVFFGSIIVFYHIKIILNFKTFEACIAYADTWKAQIPFEQHLSIVKIVHLPLFLYASPHPLSPSTMHAIKG